MDIKELSGVLRENGIVGAGGAGFPTYAKLNENAETIILNCAECEPLLRLHRQLLEKHTREILSAFSMMGRVMGSKDMVIGIKRAYTEAVDALKQCIGDYEGMRIGLLDEVYPAGDEVVLIYEVTGKVVRPGGLPIQSGVAVFNVETVYNVYRAINRNVPVVDKLVSVAGEVNHPVTLRVPIGCTIEEVVEMAGGITTKNPVYFVGGPMMGYIGRKMQPVTKTTNAILVLPEDHLIVQKKKSKGSIDLKRAAASCCQCTMCTDLCPRHLLGHPIEPHKFMRAATCKDLQDTDAFVNTLFCSSCGLCEMYSCMQGLSPRSLMAEYKAGLRAHGVKAPSEVTPKPVGEERGYRKVPMERLIARLDLTKYDRPAPLTERTVEVSRVCILLSQHIGKPAKAIVKAGDKVEKGQVIAEPQEGLSVAIHASVREIVTQVSEKYVIIEKQGGYTSNE